MKAIETSTTPVTTGKKKKKKAVHEERELDTRKSEDDITSPKSVEEVCTPTKKKKKKKFVEGESETELLSPSEDIVSPKGKKTKKKAGISEGKHCVKRMICTHYTVYLEDLNVHHIIDMEVG